MVLESPQRLQISSTPLLECIPKHSAVTLEETVDFRESPSSGLEIILDKLQERAVKNSYVDLDRVASLNSNHPDDSCVFYDSYDSLQQRNPMGKDNDVCDLSPVFSDNTQMNQLPVMSAETLNQPDFGLTQLGSSSLDDIETDCATSPNVVHAAEQLDLLESTSSLDVLSSSFSSSDDDEGLCDASLSTDPRFVRKFEQALRLGYSEQNVVKVLRKHGLECGLNDLLSELITLGGSDPDVLLSHALAQEADLVDYDAREYTAVAPSCGMTLYTPASVSESSLVSSGLDNNLPEADGRNNLHYIIIDGSNVAMSHGKTVFSCRGIQLAVDWFQARGHENITVFIPQWRKEASRPDALITDQEMLYDLEKQGIVVFTPARRVKGRRVVCYDDRFILKLAVETGGVVVSNDVYRDLVREKEEFQQVVDHRLLMYSFVNDRFMPPEDPLGRLGPTLDDFLCKTPAQPHPRPPNCPYGKKCTYGNKCRFYHPERGFAPQKSITETLKEQAQVKLQERASKMLEVAEKGKRHKQKLLRTKSMIPNASLPSPSCPNDTSEAKSKPAKPKFSQSKSLIFPVKSSDYLNEPRKKLEEAEHAANLEQMVTDELSFGEKCSLKVFDAADSDPRLSPRRPSLRASPSYQSDALLQNALASDSQLNPTFPLNVSNTYSPGASPTLQNTAPSETSEKYVSGHLLLAKKLSYENKEGSFRSDHVSNVSSAQISSPAVAAGKASDHAQFSQKDFTTWQDINFNINSPGSPQLYPYYNEQNPQQAYTSMAGPYPGVANSPSASTQAVGRPVFRQHIDTGDTSPPFRHKHIDMVKFIDYMNSRSPDGSIYTSTEGIPKTHPNHPEGQFQVYKSYPPSSTQQCPSLHRAYSSTDNVTTAEELQRRLSRRMSGFTVSQLNGDLVPNQFQQHGVPVQLTSTPCQFGQSPGLSRQNSISDPQIHSSSGVGNFPDLLSPIHQDRHFDNFYPSQNQQFPKHIQHFQQQDLQQNYQQDQRNNHDYFKTQQHQHQADSSQFPQPISRPGIVNWGQSVHPTNQDNIYSPGKAATPPGLYNPHQNTTFIQNTSYVPHFLSGTPTQNMPVTSNSHTYNSAHNQTTTPYPQSPILQPPFYRPIPTNPFSTGHDFHSHPMSAQQNNSIPQNNSQSSQSPLNSQIFNEDSAILPNDVRYTIYYHLSSVFGEPIVRKVLNLNPDTLDPTKICQLLMKYKETRSWS